MSITTERLGSLILRELVYIINDVVKNSQIGYITLTETKVTKDLSFCTVYYTILRDEKEIIAKAQQVLDENKKVIRMRLAEKIRNMRKIPDLIFKYDEALAYGNHINKLLNEIK
ncbi:30S ribosome-binding factor RbfA [Acholeplasma hippikon]|uniref:Ribosome-binding factor A n=1 Tax=Acholeplasma hippikon TaxID=264636 RepID=A0A449BJM7_9MOLU|nr:30S ribosome-binding factor RbfA [Acholeplasma hippikon]VEU82671.1 ribosome-binding factor A [Acholeplasma hippikon]